jgi:thiol-disulfide isomerase/thioredoxin
MKAITTLLIIVSISLSANTQQLKPGDKIPEITIPNLMNAAQTEVTLQSLKGKVIILDFWATWCIPCVQAFPKLGKLQTKFGSDVQVIAVSNESPERVARFIKNRPVSIWFAADTTATSSLRRSFPYISLPHVVIIDKAGIVRAITQGDELTEEVVAQVQRGLTPAVSFKEEIVTNGNVFNKVPAGEAYFGIKGYQEGIRASKSMDPNSITYTNMHFSTIFMDLYNLAYTRLRYENVDPAEQRASNETRYSVYIATTHSNRAKMVEEMKQKLQEELAYKSRIEKERDTVWILKRVGPSDTSFYKPANSTKSSGSNKSKLHTRNEPIGKATAKYIESFGLINGIVIDETGDQKMYDIAFEWEPEKEGALTDVLNKLGLQLERGIREYDILVIYK